MGLLLSGRTAGVGSPQRRPGPAQRFRRVAAGRLRRERCGVDAHSARENTAPRAPVPLCHVQLGNHAPAKGFLHLYFCLQPLVLELAEHNGDLVALLLL